MKALIFSEKIDLLKELAGAAKAFNASVTALVVGDDAVADEVARCAEEVLLVDKNDIGEFSVDVYSDLLANVFQQVKPDVTLLGSTIKGNAVAAYLSAKLNIPCLSEVMSISDSTVTKSALGGVAVADVKVSTPLVLTVKQGYFSPPEVQGKVEKVKFSAERKVEIVERRKKEAVEGYETAEVVVVAGRGVKKREDLSLVEELAKVLGGVAGVTRPLSADLHWYPIWIGMSGIQVKPKLYIGIGVSGQIQHMAGIRDSKIIVAINIDSKAPIFEYADYGIVGDLYKVVPKLIERLKQ